MRGLQLEKAGSGGKWPGDGKRTVGGQRSWMEREKELGQSGQAGPGQWGDPSPWNSWS